MKGVSRCAAAAAVAGAAFFAGEVNASAFELGTPASEHPYRSPQNFALELRFSPYKPQIDEEPGLANAPYHQTFGSMRRLLVQFELDWQVLFKGRAVSRIKSARFELDSLIKEN